MKDGMETQIRYVDFGLISKELYTGIWEYQTLVDIQQPTIIQWSMEKNIPVFFGVYPDDITYILDELDDKVRIFDCINSAPPVNKDGKVLIDQELGIPTTAFYLEGPRVTNLTLFSKKEQDHVWTRFQDSISEEASKFDIEVKWNSRNDASFFSDGKWKKCIGGGKVDVFDWTETNITISYELDIDMANHIRKLDYKKKLKAVLLDKEEFVGNMGDIMGGLSEVYPSINQEKFNLDVIKNISSKLNYTLEYGSPTTEELENISNRGKMRLWNKQWMNQGIDMHYKE